MYTLFMNSGNSKTSDPHRLLVILSDKVNLKREDKYVALSNLSIYYTWKNVKKSYKKNKFKISAPTWNEEFELPDGSYSVSDIQVYFEYILKKHERVADNPSIKIYLSKIENRITFKIKKGYYLELLTPETMKLRGSTTSKINKDKYGENVHHLEINEVVLIHWILLTRVISKIEESCIHLFLTNHLVIIKYFSKKFYIFKKFWFRIFIYWSIVYWSKFQTTRDRR